MVRCGAYDDIFLIYNMTNFHYSDHLKLRAVWDFPKRICIGLWKNLLNSVGRQSWCRLVWIWSKKFRCLKLDLIRIQHPQCSSSALSRYIPAGISGCHLLPVHPSHSWIRGSREIQIPCSFHVYSIHLVTRTLTLEPHTACRKGGWGLEYKIKRN